MSKIYTSIQGDTWDKIAKDKLGSEFFMAKLIECNFNLRHYAILPAGIKVVIPDIAVDRQTLDPQLLPPWKR